MITAIKQNVLVMLQSGIVYWLYLTQVITSLNALFLALNLDFIDWHFPF